VADGVTIDLKRVARATGALVARVAGGIALGLAVGAFAFAIERALHLLDSRTWTWALLLLYPIAGGAAFGYGGFVLGKRRAAEILLLESGLVAHLARRAAAKLDTGSADLGTGSGLVRWVKRLAMDIINAVLQLRGEDAGDPVAAAESQAREVIEDWGSIGLYLALLGFAAAIAIAPIAIAV
jgi:hypothetical protein